MRKPINKTNRKGIYVIYSESKKKGKKVVFAQLADEHGMAIDGCFASYTMQSYDTDDDARIAARNKALQKFDEKFARVMAESIGNTTNFFATCWLDIPEEKRLDLAPEEMKNKNSKEQAVGYFESNTLPLLDVYGPFISADQCREVSEALYIKTLMSKKYTFCYVDKASAATIVRLMTTVKQFLTKEKCVKSTLGTLPKKEDVDALMDVVQTQIMSEDRLRSLLEFTLVTEEHLESFVSKRLWGKITGNGDLIAQLRKLKLEETRLAVAERVLFLLRELSGNETQTKLQANKHIREANAILSNLCIASTKVMPAITLPEFVVTHVPQIEACKELPWRVRTRFSAICMFIADKEPDGVGGIMMETSGPRVAEVCAIQYGDILDFGNWGVCVINYTVDGDIRKEDGKNIYFHRPIFFPKFAMDAIHKRKYALLDMGYTEEQLRNAYVVNRDGDLFSPVNLHAFSAKIKKLLRIAGCVDEYWESLHYAMTVQPDLDYFQRAELFDIAYGLRRDATTMMCNIAKIHPFKVDAILGHCLPRYAEDWNTKITREDEWTVIIDELERIVYDPEHSNHPLFAPLNAMNLVNDDGIARKAIEYHGIAITADLPVQLEAKVKTVGNSDVHFVIPAGSKHQSAIESISNTAGPCQWLGTLHSKEEYDHIKSQAIEDYLKEIKNNESLKKHNKKKTVCS